MEDLRLVRQAVERGYVSQDQLERAKQEQRSLADRGVEHSLWFILQDLGYLSEEHARQLRKGMSSSVLRALEVDGHTLQGRLGSGGMGDVFRAERLSDHHAVAVKLLSSKFLANQEYQARFSREADATLRLDHPHIVRSLSTGEIGGVRFLMMELVEGLSLKQAIAERGRISGAEARCILAQMADALGYAWKHGVLHRDVKPANIILGTSRPGIEEPFCAKLCDFGLAKVWQQPGQEAERGQLTGAGLALGTPHYMSPEQASGEQDLDQRSDIYGLGASLYHALLGHTMYSGKSSAVIMYKQVTESLDLKELDRTDADPGLRDLLGRMLVKDRSRRIATWEAVQARLAAGPETQPPGPPRPAAPLVGPQEPAGQPRRGLGLALLVAVLITLGLATAAWVWLAEEAVSPGNLDRRIATVAAHGGGELRLRPGFYQGPWHFGPGHRGLVLRAEGPGVVLRSPMGGGAGPLVSCGPGLEGLVLDGICLEAHGVTALALQAGSRALLRGCQVATLAAGGDAAPPTLVVEGELSLEGTRVLGRVDLRPGGRVNERAGASP